MWDLDTLHLMNAPRRVKHAEKVKTQPLEFLAQKLLRAPPSLSALIGQLRDREEYGQFLSLVREYVPEHEREILRIAEPATQVAAFASRFEDRYFPLDDNIKSGGAEGYADLTRFIPVIVMGMTYDDYEQMSQDGRPAAQLLTYLFENPYVGGERAALAEACAEHVSEELLQRVPEGGFTCDLAHELLDKTRFKAAVLWADYINANTGNFFLDTDYELLWSGYAPQWDDKETVLALVGIWQQAEKHQEEVYRFMDWLEQDAPSHFKELLDFIEERKRKNRKEVSNGSMP